MKRLCGYWTYCLLLCDCHSALKEMSASERHLTSIQELIKNAVFMKQQIRYETLRRYSLLVRLSAAYLSPSIFGYLTYSTFVKATVCICACMYVCLYV